MSPFEQFLHSVNISMEGGSSRLRQAIEELGCKSIADVEAISDAKWLAYPGLGARTLRLLRRKLKPFRQKNPRPLNSGSFTKDLQKTGVGRGKGPTKSSDSSHKNIPTSPFERFLSKNVSFDNGKGERSPNAGVVEAEALEGCNAQHGGLRPSDSIMKLRHKPEVVPSLNRLLTSGITTIIEFAALSFPREEALTGIWRHEMNLLMQVKLEAWRVCRDVSVNHLELNVRTSNCIRLAGIRTIQQLVCNSKGDLLAIQNFGNGSFKHLTEVITSVGLNWGLNLTEISPKSLSSGSNDVDLRGIDISQKYEIEETDFSSKSNPLPQKRPASFYDQLFPKGMNLTGGKNEQPSNGGVITPEAFEGCHIPNGGFRPSDSIVMLPHKPEVGPLLRRLLASKITTIMGLATLGLRQKQWPADFQRHEIEAMMQVKLEAWRVCSNLSVDHLGLNVRTSTCLELVGIRTIQQLVSKTEKDLLAIHNFGIGSFSHLTEVITSVGLHWGLNLAEDSCDDMDLELLGGETTFTEGVLGKILFAASVVCGAQSIGDLRDVDMALLIDSCDLEKKELVKPLRAVAPITFGSNSVSNIVFHGLKYLNSRELKTILQRELAAPSEKTTLEKLGTTLDVSRERVRQIQATATRKFDAATLTQLRRISRLFLARHGDVFRTELLDKGLTTYFSVNETPSGIPIKRQALLRAAGYVVNSAGWSISPKAQKEIHKWPTRLRETGKITGIISAAVIERDCRPFFATERECEQYLEEVVGIGRFQGHFLRSNSCRNRVLAALFLAGRPSTKEEISEITGVLASQVTSYLSGFDQICRADKIRWSFREWTDDPYDGITGEIVQRINEDGGSTTIDRLLDEIPRLFAVSENSVRTYLASRQFVVEKGIVREATSEELTGGYYGLVENHPGAVKLEDGNWAARVVLEQRFFDGYSASIPTVIAHAQGIRPGDSFIVPVKGYSYDVSIIWRPQTTTNSVDLGRIQSLLVELSVAPGDVLIVSPSPENVRLWREGEEPRLGPEFTETRVATNAQKVDEFINDIFKK